MKKFLSLYDESDDYLATDAERSPLCEQLASYSNTYSDEQVIGKGGMKTVSRVFCSGTQRYVARATLNDRSNPDLRDAFVREARMTAMLDHPNIIKIYEIALSDSGDPYFTMELKTGQSLAELVKTSTQRECEYLKGNTEQGLPSNEDDIGALQKKNDIRNFLFSGSSFSNHRTKFLEIFLKVCDAVAYSHSRGVLHLDLKPDNIQVGSFGEVVVCDWGLGKILDDENANYTLHADMLNHCTLFGEAKGTPGYMAPEQIDNSRKAMATDIYALGAILFSMLAPNRLRGKMPKALLEETSLGVPDNLYEKEFHLPASLRAVIEKAMQKDAAERYESVEELHSDVSKYLNGYPTNAEDAGFMVQSSFFWIRNRKICIVISVALAFIIGGLLIFMSRLSKSEQRALVALQESKSYASALEKAILENKDMETSLKTMPKEIVGNIFARNQQYRDYHLLMTPEISVKRSNQYLEAGLNVQPDNWYMYSALRCNYLISMDFEKLGDLIGQSSHNAKRYKKFLEKQDGNGFQTFKDIVTFSEIGSKVFMELPVAYNANRFRNHPEFPTVISRLITRWYPESGNVKLDYDGVKLVVTAPKLTKLISPPVNMSLLRYLHFKELIITASSIDDARQFAGLSVLKLDLRGTDIHDLTPLLELPTLDHVRIRKGQIPEVQIKRFSNKFSIEVDRIYEAEKSDLDNETRFDKSHQGYSGSGFVAGFYNNEDGTAMFRVHSAVQGHHTISLRYSAGHGDVDIEVICNSNTQRVRLSSTEDSWKLWSLADIPVTLKEGVNYITVKMKTSSRQCINLDYLSVSETIVELE